MDETEYVGMKEVILSHDSEAMLCLVPAEVADNLDEYCLEFMFGTAEFIDYLNRWAFPDFQSKIVRGLGCYDYEIPMEYQKLPRHNF